ncbi:MAG: hypothetical protein HY094_02460 [Candidatus Melainabacteria bacterium]|nr:hypothetical protein [Candidatus Melainabacteria bacterium]
MSTNYQQSNPNRLRSPLLDGLKTSNNQIKGKKTYYNLKEENKQLDVIGETVDLTLFNNTVPKSAHSEENKNKNYQFINSLETVFKIACMLIGATGGILSLIELIIVVKTLYSGSFNFGNSLIVFTAAFIGTILATVTCTGFTHLIKTTKFIYSNLESQKRNIETLLSYHGIKHN